jgi:hypothetical protein
MTFTARVPLGFVRNTPEMNALTKGGSGIKVKKVVMSNTMPDSILQNNLYLYPEVIHADIAFSERGTAKYTENHEVPTRREFDWSVVKEGSEQKLLHFRYTKTVTSIETIKYAINLAVVYRRENGEDVFLLTEWVEGSQEEESTSFPNLRAALSTFGYEIEARVKIADLLRYGTNPGAELTLSHADLFDAISETFKSVKEDRAHLYEGTDYGAWA